MFKELRDFIIGYPDNFGFDIDQDVFVNGLKFSFKEKYPWKNKKERYSYLDKLFEEETVQAYQKVLRVEETIGIESIHINYSFALVCRLFSVLFIALSILLLLIGIIPSLIYLGCAALLLLSDLIFRKKASHMKSEKVLLTFLANNEIKKKLNIKESKDDHHNCKY